MIAETLEGRHLVLTGVTGFLGKVFLVMLLDRFPSIGRVTVLVRGGSNGASERFRTIAARSPAFRPLRARHGAQLGEFLAERVEVLDSDLDQPDCGLDARARGRLHDADLFLHCAGITDFDPDPKKALGTNTHGALRVAALAKQVNAPLLHVSTCYVAGIADGDVPETLQVGVSPNGTAFDPLQMLQEADRFVHRPRRSDRVDRGREHATKLGWPNIYTWSKGLAEHALAADPELKLTIVRPSIVECAQQFPFPGWNEGINTAGPLAWLISTAFRRFPATGSHRFDIIPVDEVAKGLLLTVVAALRGQAPQVVQLASSDSNPFTLERAVELTGLGLRRYVRKGGGTPRERTWFRHLDPIAAKGGWIAPFDDKGWIQPARTELDSLLQRELPDAVQRRLTSLAKSLKTLSTDVDRIDTMLRLYKPFIHDHDWRFHTDHVRSWSAALPAEEQDMRFAVPEIEWRDYWVDIEYPGLQKWCIPLLRGDTVPDDPPFSLELRSAERVASK